MMPIRHALTVTALLLAAPALAQSTPPGKDQAVGQNFLVTSESLPAPGATDSVAASSQQVARGDHLPIVPDGFSVNLFLDGLPDPRRFLVASDGTIYMAAQSAGIVISLSDADGDGKADAGQVILQGLRGPFGLGFAGGDAPGLIASDVNGLYRAPLEGGSFAPITDAGVFGRPKGHTTRSVAIDPKSGDIFVGVGSVNNISDSEEKMKATIQRFAAGSTTPTTYATGMRNVTAMAFQPGTDDLYAVTMERDGMGDELVPDYLTRVQQGDDFGWPFQYIGGNGQPDYANSGVKRVPAKVPDVLFAAHSAPLDLAFVPDSWPEHYRGGVIVALHGSWNAGQPRGYKLVFVPFKDGRPTGGYENFMTGFWVSGTSPAEVWGRPAALAFLPDGALLVGDDLGGSIWRVAPPKS
ncbi:MAG: PQQ-dependent sugar dehydrogenase [Devosia sp.]